MSEREQAVPITEGRCSKGGQNPPNPTTARPPAPGGSGGSVLGRCPICGGKGVLRERRPHGNDRCENGHVYASSQAVTGAPDLQSENAALRAQVERLEAVWKGADHPDRDRIECGDRIALLVEEREHKHAPLKPRLVMVTALETCFKADDQTFDGYSPEDAKAWARESDLLAAVLRETGP